VVTRPDRPAGRGRRRQPTLVKETAAAHGLEVFQPEQVSAPEALGRLRALKPDLLLLAAYGQILSADVLAVAELAAINVHPSLLPKYRGAAPIAWALLRGEKETGVTIITMTEEVDAGLVLAQEATPVGEDETAGDLEPRLAKLGARLLVSTLGRLDEALTQARPQGPSPTDGSATAPRLSKADGLVDWTRPAEELCNRVRGLTPWPGAYSFLQRDGAGERVKLVRVAAVVEGTEQPPGAVVAVSADALLVQTGRGLLSIRELQPAGKRVMEVSAFLRGHAVKEGDHFGGHQ